MEAQIFEFSWDEGWCAGIAIVVAVSEEAARARVLAQGGPGRRITLQEVHPLDAVISRTTESVSY